MDLARATWFKGQVKLWFLWRFKCLLYTVFFCLGYVLISKESQSGTAAAHVLDKAASVGLNTAFINN